MSFALSIKKVAASFLTGFGWLENITTSFTLFISYSHAEAPFVESFASKLRSQRQNIWLDYRNLVPAQPWAEQINDGIQNADAFLLIVSKSSMTSKYVEEEWRRAVALKKRIILVIFEAARLPNELLSCEWIDMRGHFYRDISHLLQQLESHAAMKKPPPQSGFKAPFLVWVTAFFSIVPLVMSIPTWWTLYVPYVLVPLPFRILRRDFDFYQVRFVTLMLPILFFTTVIIFYYDQRITRVVSYFCLYSFLPAILLLISLYDAGMQRWGTPMASRPSFSKPYKPKIAHPKPTQFTIDFAAEDQKYADDIITTLKKYGHQLVADGAIPEVVLVVMSRFKNGTLFDPEQQIVLPIVVENPRRVDSKLGRVQWIDFRRGMRHLDVLAELLPERSRLLEALGIPPSGNQVVLPPIIQSIEFLLILLAVFSIGSTAVLFFQYGSRMFNDFIIRTGILLPILIVLLWGTIATTRSIRNRGGTMASLGRLVGMLLLIGLLVFSEYIIVGFILPIATYVVGVLVTLWRALWSWQDLRRWFPAQAKTVKPLAAKGASVIE